MIAVIALLALSVLVVGSGAVWALVPVERARPVRAALGVGWLATLMGLTLTLAVVWPLLPQND